MYDIRHRIGVEASPRAVYEQVATIDGLRQWWTSDTRGASDGPPAVGDTISFHFGGAGLVPAEPEGRPGARGGAAVPARREDVAVRLMAA